MADDTAASLAEEMAGQESGFLESGQVLDYVRRLALVVAGTPTTDTGPEPTPEDNI